ncbi:hypothetical protein BDW71DRAFT_212710 [Aspergillus fruticulosus]
MPHIIIIGAGLAGLASALSLRRAGHKVRVFEASQLTPGDTEGTVSQIGPKVDNILKRWGVDAAVARPVLIREVFKFGLNGELKSKEDGPKPVRGQLRQLGSKMLIKPVYIQPGWKYYQRSRLHEALLKAATSPEGVGDPVVLVLGTTIDAIDPQAGLVTLQDGQAYHGDAIIGADGWNSVSRRAAPHNGAIVPAPAKVAIHLSVDISAHEQNEIVRRFRLQPERYEIWTGADVELKVYSVDSGSILVDATLPVRSDTDLCAQSLESQLLRKFHSTDSPLGDLLAAAEAKNLQFWFHPNLPVVREWALGRLALIGDAAHPFLPFEPPGTSQSITGADALADALGSDVRVEDVPKYLAAWVSPRKERVKTIQGMERKGWLSAS